MAGFALFAVFHGFDAADSFFLGGERLFGGFGGDRMTATGVAAVLASVLAFFYGSAGLFLHGYRGFLDVGGTEGAEVIRGLEADVPGLAIHVAECLQIRSLQPEVNGLGLVDPLLTAGGGFDDPLEVDVEGGEVFRL